MKVILEGKVPLIMGRTSLVQTNCARKTDGGLRPTAVGNTFRRFSAKRAGYHVFESGQQDTEIDK